MSNCPIILPLKWMKLAVSCALMAGLCACGAQDIRYLSHQSWSTEEGIPQSSVHSIAQTRDGYLWIATEAGLARFDGVAFRVFDHTVESAFVSDDIHCLAVDSAGLWIGTADGLLRLQQGRFRRFGTADNLPSSSVESITAGPDGLIAVKTSAGWAQWKRAGFQALSTGHVEATVDGLGLTPAQGNVTWSSSVTAVAMMRPGVRREWRIGRELPQGRIQTVVVDRQGLAWVGMNTGLLVLNPEQTTAMPVGFLSGNSVLSIFQDSEGNHWIGTETSGLHVLRRLKFRSEPGLADKAVTSIAQTMDTTIWVGTRDEGLRRIRDGVLDEPVAETKLTSSVILCLAPGAHGGLWVGTPDGLSYVDERGLVQRITSSNGLPDDYVRSLAADSDGSVWAGTRHGLAHVRRSGERFTINTLTKADGLGGDMIGSLLLTTGKEPNSQSVLWVGTSGGLTRVRRDGQIRNFTIEDGPEAQIITSMAQDVAGDLWVVSKNGGLSLFDGQRLLSVGGFPQEKGRSGAVEGVSVDKLDLLWLRMDRGIERVSGKVLHGCAGTDGCSLPDQAIAHYGLADGLPNDEVVGGGLSMAWLARNGELWFPTRGGVAIADTGHLPWNTVAPPVVIERFLVDDNSQELTGMPSDISFGHARFTMEYAGLSFSAPSEVRYRFRLQGFDKDFTDAGNRRSATYTNLPPRSYRFQVQAMNNDGVWNDTGAELQFRIVPPFYRRWWFIALNLIVLMTLLAGIYLLRLRRLQREFSAVLAERNRMAREIHDTLTQDFVATSLQLDLVSQQLSRGKIDVAIDQVKRARQLVTEGLEEARRSIWELRVNNSQDSLPTRLAKVVQRDSGAGVLPQLRVGGAYRPLNAQLEREVLRIAQEALSNLQHHAHATEGSVELHYSSDTLMLMIEDNGVGFALDEASRKGGHYGLLGMQERASMIDATLEIVSRPGHGTVVTLRVPIAPIAR